MLIDHGDTRPSIGRVRHRPVGNGGVGAVQSVVRRRQKHLCRRSDRRGGVDQVVASDCLNARRTHQVDLDGIRNRLKRDCLNAAVSEVEYVTWGSGVWDEGGNAVAVENT